MEENFLFKIADTILIDGGEDVWQTIFVSLRASKIHKALFLTFMRINTIVLLTFLTTLLLMVVLTLIVWNSMLKDVKSFQSSRKMMFQAKLQAGGTTMIMTMSVIVEVDIIMLEAKEEVALATEAAMTQTEVLVEE